MSGRIAEPGGHGTQHRLDVTDIALPLPPVDADPGDPTEDDATERKTQQERLSSLKIWQGADHHHAGKGRHDTWLPHHHRGLRGGFGDGVLAET